MATSTTTNTTNTYVAVVEGKRFPIPPEIGDNDQEIAGVLAAYCPELAEADGAEYERDEKDGVVIITVTPRAKSKGTVAAAGR